MCGIAGIVQVGGRGVDRALLTAMTTAQAHRGPDGDGFVCRGGAGFGPPRQTPLPFCPLRPPPPHTQTSLSAAFSLAHSQHPRPRAVPHAPPPPVSSPL